MLAEVFSSIKQAIEPRFKPEIIDYTDPKTNAVKRGYFGPDGKWNALADGASDAKFPPVKVFSAVSMIEYAKSHAGEAIKDGRALLTVNKNGLRLSIDYGAKEEPERTEHVVTFPASFDEECEVAARAIVTSLGDWLPLKDFDAILDKCAPFIANFLALEEAAYNMEGRETAKSVPSKTGYQVQVTGEVSCVVEIPKTVSVRLLFMGNPISADIPLRLTVENKQIKFHFVDNGAIAKAKMDVLRKIKAEIVTGLEGLLVIDGTIGN